MFVYSNNHTDITIQWIHYNIKHFPLKITRRTKYTHKNQSTATKGN